MTEAGHNRPPEMLTLASEIANNISAWLAEHPVIETEDVAREAKMQLDRGRLALADMETERDGKVRPLNAQVKAINDSYVAPRSLISKVVAVVQARLAMFLQAEELKRQRIAEEAQRKAREAEQLAREAEQAEREAQQSAAAGELGVNIAAAVQIADEKFAAYQKAERQAAVAEKDAHVKIGGGIGRAIGLRTVEILFVTNGLEAIKSIGITKDVEEAIIKGARAYRRLHGRLPNGVIVRAEQKV